MGSSPFFFRGDKMLNRGLDKLELLRIVEAVANEKSIDKELVIDSMESAIQKAALTKFGNDNNIEVIIDRESGDIKIQKVLDIVDKVEDFAREITLEDALKINPKNKDLKGPLQVQRAMAHIRVDTECRPCTSTGAVCTWQCNARCFSG